MKMVEFLKITPDYVTSYVRFSKREEFFRNYFEKIKIVPSYVIMESIFQTAGRLIRCRTNDQYGGIIASFSKFNFERPILPNEDVIIHTEFVSEINMTCMTGVSVEADSKKILNRGKLMLMYEPAIISDRLNNQVIDENKKLVSYFYENLNEK